MRAAKTLDFLPESEPVVQILPEAAAMVDHVHGQICQATEAEVNHE